jgi:hypothetical protein
MKVIKLSKNLRMLLPLPLCLHTFYKLTTPHSPPTPKNLQKRGRGKSMVYKIKQKREY